MKRTPLNHFSPKKIAQLNEEAPIRIALCHRARGTPIVRKVVACISGQRYEYTKVECHNGYCEVKECGKQQIRLEPHEDLHRSLGGKLTLENSKMVCRECHRKLQKNEPMFTKSP